MTSHDVEEGVSWGGYGYGQPITSGSSSSNWDRVLYNDLVQIVPLVQSLIDGKSTSSFSRRGAVTYTKAPSRDPKKKNDARNKHRAKSPHGKKQEHDEHSTSSVNMVVEKDTKELKAMREELEDLRRKLAEKDELLKSTQVSMIHRNAAQSQVDELKRCADEKDALIKATQQQLHDAKIKLADKQASVEKLQWEAKTSNQKVERLQEELNSMQSEISSFMLLFEGLSKDNPTTPAGGYDITPLCLECLPEMDDIEEMEVQKMEEAREAYLAALAIAKEKQDEESLVAATRARLILQSFVFKSEV